MRLSPAVVETNGYLTGRDGIRAVEAVVPGKKCRNGGLRGSCSELIAGNICDHERHDRGQENRTRAACHTHDVLPGICFPTVNRKVGPGTGRTAPLYTYVLT